MLYPLLKRLGASLTLLCSFLLFSGHAGGVTPEQLSRFEALPKAQQEALKKQYLKRGQNGKSQSIAPLDSPTTVVPFQRMGYSIDAESSLERAAKKATDEVSLEEEKEEKKLADELRQFGYDLFAGQATTFAPVTDIPIPSDYVIGPGDTLQAFLFGKENAEHHLQVNREGELNFPGIGPIQVAGMPFAELKRSINERIAQQMIGVRASITLGQLRSIRVFILGDVLNPGSYTVSALSTMTNALFVSGGITKIGSLRNIQLKRRGKIVTTLDLYDLLLRGDTSKDVRIQPGDVLFVPPVGPVAGVGGEVRRPALYELKGENTVEQLIAMAGGLLPTADRKASQLDRVSVTEGRQLLDLDLTKDRFLSQSIQQGDTLKIYSVLERMDSIVMLSGHVQRPGGAEWKSGMRLSDLIQDERTLLSEADLSYVVIKRESGQERSLEILISRLDEVLRDYSSPENVRLMPRDEVVVLSLGEERRAALEPLIDELEERGRFGKPEPVVTIEGNVKQSGKYPYQAGMRVSRLIEAALDVLPNTDLDYALVRREENHSGNISVNSFSLREVMAKRHDLEKNFVLQPRDQVIILPNSVLADADDNNELISHNLVEMSNEARRQKLQVRLERQVLIDRVVKELELQSGNLQPAQIVSVAGKVRFPGRYPLEDGMSVSDLLTAAGGLEESAYMLEAELTRRVVVEGQYRIAKYQLFSLNRTENDIDQKLQSHDHIYIRKLPQWNENQTITLEGEVRFPGEYPIAQGETVAQLLERAGGLTEYAYPQGALFSREALRKKEREENEGMIRRLERELASLSIENLNANPQQSNAVDYVVQLLNKMREIEPLGRLSIDLPKVMKATTLEQSWALEVKHGDRLVIPQKPVSVTTVGEVYYPSSHMYQEGITAEEYIELSGGFTQNANKENYYIVHANGQVESGKQGAWFRTVSDGKVQAGDTIVAPLDAERMKPLTLFTNVADIAAKVATATANLIAIGSL